METTSEGAANRGGAEGAEVSAKGFSGSYEDKLDAWSAGFEAGRRKAMLEQGADPYRFVVEGNEHVTPRVVAGLIRMSAELNEDTAGCVWRQSMVAAADRLFPHPATVAPAGQEQTPEAERATEADDYWKLSAEEIEYQKLEGQMQALANAHDEGEKCILGMPVCFDVEREDFQAIGKIELAVDSGDPSVGLCGSRDLVLVLDPHFVLFDRRMFPGVAAILEECRRQIDEEMWTPGHDDTLAMIQAEVLRARAKFPGNEHMFVALVEEVGELGQALLKLSESKWPRQRVVEEATQVACMAVRIIEEGDADFPGSQPFVVLPPGPMVNV